MEVKSSSEGSGDGEDSAMPTCAVTGPKSTSFSPKVVRPKLPSCAGTRSPSRSKTDPGREEIQSILEDIQNLKKIDFKTFIRPRHLSGHHQHQPHPGGYSTLPYKSQSTTTSPNQSPRIGSPTVDDPHFTRDRSRSLKILTDRLKNKSGKLLGEQLLHRQGSERTDFRREGSVPTEFLRVSHGPSPDRCSVERVDEVEEEGAESEPLKPVNRKVGHAALASITPQHSDDSLDSREADPHGHNDTPDFRPVSPHRERTPDSDTHLGAREKSPESGDYPQAQSGDGEQAARPKMAQERMLEDEGVSEISDAPRPIVSSTTHTFHPTIGRNKKFLKLVNTAPCPKRRTGITTLATLGHVQAMYGPGMEVGGRGGRGEDAAFGQAEEAASRGRPHRRSEASPVASHSHKGGARFITHPPHKKASGQEEGSVDSNGFSALKMSCDDGDGDSDEETKQQSQTSLADSQLASEGSDHLSYPDVVESVMGGLGSDTSDSEKQEKKNGKSGKQKSRSDPNGDRSRESLDIAPNLDSNQSHSAPLLNKEEEEDSVIDEEFHLARSDNTLSPPPQGLADESGGERTSEDEDDIDMEGSAESGDVLALPTSTVAFSSTPPTPINQSPTSTLERPSHLPTGLLTVPSASMPKKPISRSASSASVLPSRKQTLLNSRDREPRKYSITTDEAMTPSRSATHLVPDFTPLGDSSAATSMPVVWKDRLSSTDSPEREPGFIKDKRYHIVEELYRNEREYVEALRVLKEKYMAPLKNSSNVDDAIVDNIFYMIPEILMHHAVYLDVLDKVWRNWDSKTSTVGDLIQSIFSKQTIVESYLSFVENYNTSGKVIENALTTKSSMQKFIEQCQKESGSKLSMKDLIVRPIQRIPRYELLIQRLLDNTPGDHPDYPLLQRACRTMHDLAMRIGTVTDSQHEEDMQETLKKLELLLITDLVAPERAYIRHDMVQLLNKKDQCCFWLFSDLIILSSVKRKSGPVTRKVSIILKTPGGQDFTENIKHKVWLKVGLDCLEIVKTHSSTLSRKPTIDKEQVEEDLQTVNQITDLCSRLTAPHQGLEDAVKELSTNLTKQLAEATMRYMASESNKLELLVTTQEGVLHLEITFTSAEKRATWEVAFTDAKNKLSLLTDKRAPEFLQPLQITKTRAGMQFSCAAPIDGLNASGYRDVWVCNSDGYVGHMCLLSLQPEPIVTLNTPVPGCNARILCICAVPAFSGAFRRRSSQKGRTHRLGGGGGDRGDQRPLIQVECPEQDEGEEEEKSTASDQRRRRAAARGGSRSRERSGKREEERAGGKKEEGEKGGGDEEDMDTEEGYQSDSDSSDDEDDDDAMPFMRNTELYVDLQSDEEVHRPKVSELTQSSPDPITTSGSWQQDPVKSTMWLGTEDGCIHIFQCTDNIKTTKNKLKIQHGSPVYCIIYLDNKVFASLVNGDLIVYKRDSEGMWDTEHPYTRTIGSATAPITRMLAVAGKLWCGCHNTVHVINPLALNIERSFQVVPDPSRTVQCMVSSGQGVWVACQHSSKVSLFHATTYEFLLEVSVAQAVSQKLQSADDIIRQHKAACLRITALLVCKDLLWVGTSAGVILTVPIPKITSTTTHGALATPTVTGLVYGHTGHVRFLTAVELWSLPAGPKMDVIGGGSGGHGHRDGHHGEGGVKGGLPDIHRRSSMAATTATMATRMLVISGGDGYEDFRNNSANESAGRDDSTNHLLLWQV
ncbi:rho guanine nucleotide exchange factor 17-like isoform X2 [Babylonia areolata]|uniref:rho guanine nucleotide exchange factor 17-like isoform X2 n=1 Tax=Babylonia areolata TaxID=304850 RepID=UPI003FCEF13F